jgi:branched-chain amino acid transport system ATP-binding protein
VRAGFGANTVLHGVSFRVREGEFATLVGLNGAGKSVTLKTISGLLPPWSGTVKLDERDLSGMEPEDRVRAGLAHVPQGRAVFPHLSVEQNLRLGGAVLRGRHAVAAAYARVYEAFPRLAERRRQLAGTLSGGEQAMLAVGRAMMPSPRLVLIDEPSAGLSPIALGELLGTIREINRAGTTVLMVEQNTTFALKISDTIHVMQKGMIVLSSPVAELGDPTDLLAYLGVGEMMSERLRAVVAARAAHAPKAKARAPAKKRTSVKKATGRRSPKKPS